MNQVVLVVELSQENLDTFIAAFVIFDRALPFSVADEDVCSTLHR